MTVLQPLVPMDDGDEMKNHDEYGLLMSLALDGLLDGAEKSRLDAHLAGCAHCRGQWSLWQSIDEAFRAAPMTAPSAAFMGNFGARLAAQERRRKLRMGIFLGALTLLLWLIGVTGAVLLLGALLYNQVGWFTDSLHWLAYLWTAVTVVASSLLALAGGVTEAPSTFGLLAAYAALATGVLAVWSRYLRRSLQMVEVA